MKKIEAIIRPEKFAEVQAAIEEVGYTGLMVTEIQGHGAQKGVVQQWRGDQYRVSLINKIKIEIVCKDAVAQKLVDAIVSSGRTGEVGDGKIFVSTIDQAVRIRSGETGDKAI